MKPLVVVLAVLVDSVALGLLEDEEAGVLPVHEDPEVKGEVLPILVLGSSVEVLLLLGFVERLLLLCEVEPLVAS